MDRHNIVDNDVWTGRSVPPLTVDDSYEPEQPDPSLLFSHNTSSDPDPPAPPGIIRLVNEARRLSDLNQNSVALQVSVQQDRQRVTRLRRLVQKWDGEIIRALREVTNETPSDPKSLTKLFRKAQDSRNKLGPLEDKLDHKEFEIQRLQIKIIESGEKIQELLQDFSHLRRDASDEDTDTETESSISESSIRDNPDTPALDLSNVPIFNASEIDGDFNTVVRESQKVELETLEEVNHTTKSVTSVVKEHIELRWLENPLVSVMSWEGGMRGLPIDQESQHKIPQEIDAIGSWGDYKTADVIAPSEALVFPAAETAAASTPASRMPSMMKEVREARKKHKNSENTVNNWLLTKLVSSVLEWTVYEAVLDAKLPKGFSYKIWDEEFIRIWNVDDNWVTKTLTPPHRYKQAHFSWLPLYLRPSSKEENDSEIWRTDTSTRVSMPERASHGEVVG